MASFHVSDSVSVVLERDRRHACFLQEGLAFVGEITLGQVQEGTVCLQRCGMDQPQGDMWLSVYVHTSGSGPGRVRRRWLGLKAGSGQCIPVRAWTKVGGLSC